jgi:glutamate-1-semialdehyde 2,1-aminomutase
MKDRVNREADFLVLKREKLGRPALSTPNNAAVAHSEFCADRHEFEIKKKTPGSWLRHGRASRTLAGGVSSGLRRNARPYPLYFEAGSGSKITDVDGNTYLDFTLAWGPLILGHSHPSVVAAIQRQAASGLTYGAQHDLEYEVSELMNRTIPCADLVCFANSGTEIVQVALRLARAVTGRRKFLKFEGHYHGWSDEALVSYHPPPAAPENRPFGVGTGQLPQDHVEIATWNDRESVERIFATRVGDISAVLFEPLLANSGCIPPAPGFLEFLREISTRNKALLIFDEVITGYRVDLGGAQSRWGVTPDLATYAKAVGGGVPLSVLAGRADFMKYIADGTVVHAGTLNGNPLCLAAARATIEVLAADFGQIYTTLRARADRLRQGISSEFARIGIKAVLSGDGPVFQISFMERAAQNYRDTLAAQSKLYSDFAVGLLNRGVLVLPDGRWYVSAVHSDEDIDRTLDAVRSVCTDYGS